MKEIRYKLKEKRKIFFEYCFSFLANKRYEYLNNAESIENVIIKETAKITIKKLFDCIKLKKHFKK